MGSVLSLDETPPALERSVRAATKRKAGLPTDLEIESIPLRELSSLAEASQNTHLTCESSLGVIRPYKAYMVSW